MLPYRYRPNLSGSLYPTSCYTTPRPYCVLILGFCSLWLHEHTFRYSNSSVLYHCCPNHIGHLANFLCVAHRVLFVQKNCCVRRCIHGFHSLGGLAVVLQNIASALSASLSASSVIVWPTVVGWFSPCWPHDRPALELLLGSTSVLSPSAGLPAVLRPHHAPWLRDLCQRLQQWGCMYLLVLNVMSKKSLNLTHIFWSVVMRFNSWIANLNLLVLWIIA